MRRSSCSAVPVSATFPRRTETGYSTTAGNLNTDLVTIVLTRSVLTQPNRDETHTERAACNRDRVITRPRHAAITVRTPYASVQSVCPGPVSRRVLEQCDLRFVSTTRFFANGINYYDDAHPRSAR